MPPRVALVHDWLTGMRGGEKVLEIFCELFPDAPIYTLVHSPGSVSATIESHPIITSPLQRIPGADKKYRHFLPVMPRLIESLVVEPVDLVLSCSSCVAKSIIPPKGAESASYILSPMRYIYDRYDDYFAPHRAGLATRTAMRMVRTYLQRWDIQTARRAEHMASISTFIADRVRRLYQRTTPVIHPPVDASRFGSVRVEPEDYYLMVTALVPYKNVDVAVEAFRGTNRRLVVAGSGPMEKALRKAAPPNVEFLGWVDDEQIPALVACCRAFLMPNVEDFGIAPIEAMAAGRPVIAYGEGGVLDTICDLDRVRAGQSIPGHRWESSRKPLAPTGLFFQEMTPAALAQAIRRFESEIGDFHPAAIRAWAEEFNIPHFRRAILQWVGGILGTESLVAAA